MKGYVDVVVGWQNGIGVVQNLKNWVELLSQYWRGVPSDMAIVAVNKDFGLILVRQLAACL